MGFAGWIGQCDTLSSHYHFRCARYPSIPSFCTMVQDPNDACCREPKCQYIAPTPVPRITPSPQPGVSIPTPSPGSQTAAPSPGSQTASPRPGNPTPAPSPGGQPTPAPRSKRTYW